MLPISVVEAKGFHDLIVFLKPDYTVPCRQTMTVWLEKMYSKAAGSLREILSLAEKVAITTDAWTALIMQSYVTMAVYISVSAVSKASADPKKNNNNKK